MLRSLNHVHRIYNSVNSLIDEDREAKLDDVLINSVGIFEDILLVSRYRRYLPVYTVKDLYLIFFM